MAFRKTPIIEEPSRCLVCSTVVPDDVFVCSGTCEDIRDLEDNSRRVQYYDWLDTDEVLYV